jgi:hypothetical protein
VAGHTITAGAPAVPIRPGQKLRLIAIDPLTGNTVTGVTLSEWAIYGDNEGDDPITPELPVEWLEVPSSG